MSLALSRSYSRLASVALTICLLVLPVQSFAQG